MCDSSRSLQFQNTFIQRSPAKTSQRKNGKTLLLIPNKIKSPTGLKKLIRCFDRRMCTKRQRPLNNQCLNCTKKNSGLWQQCNRHRNHMTPYPLGGCRCSPNTFTPKRCTPSNQSVTQPVSPKDRTNSKNLQRNPHSLRKPWSPFFIFSTIWCSPKNCNQNTKTIGACLQSNCHKQNMTIGCRRSRSAPAKFQNSVFTIISPKKRPSQEAQSSNQLTNPSQWNRCMNTTRTTHILNICTCMNYNTCSQKQQPFKTSMCHQMIHSLSIMAQCQCNDHIPQLTTSTVSNHTFHIILHHTKTPPHQTGHGSYPLKNCTGIHTTFPKAIGTGNKKNSSSHLSCSMNLCRNRGRSFHPISQPYMKSDLRAFPKGTTKQTQTNPISISRRCAQNTQNQCVCSPKTPPAGKQSNQQNSIADTIHLHSFLCCFGPPLSMKPKSNQQITTHTNHFPPNQQSNQVIRSHQNQHGSCKQTQIAQKAWQMRVMLHISLTIKMHTKTHGTHSHHHRSTQCIKAQKPRDTQSVCLKPSSLRNCNCRLKTPHFIENQKTLQSPSPQTLNSHTSTTSGTQPTTHQSCLCTSQKRRKNSIQIHFFSVTKKEM